MRCWRIFSAIPVNTGAHIMQVLVAKYRYFIPLAAQIEALQVAYEARKKANGISVDFDDLLSKTLELFQTCQDVAEIYQNQFHHMLVDEYQDTNSIQACAGRLPRPQHGALWWWGMTHRASTRGAVRISKTSCSFRSTTPAPGFSKSKPTTARA